MGILQILSNVYQMFSNIYTLFHISVISQSCVNAPILFLSWEELHPCLTSLLLLTVPPYRNNTNFKFSQENPHIASWGSPTTHAIASAHQPQLVRMLFPFVSYYKSQWNKSYEIFLSLILEGSHFNATLSVEVLLDTEKG